MEVSMRFTARDVPMWRRELTDWYASNGADYYEQMIRFGRQQIRPPGPPEQVARFLAEQEMGRLRDADLWFIETDTCELVNASHETMPPFAPVPSDLPSQRGFALFAEPVMLRDPIEETGVEQVIEHLSLMDADQSPATVIEAMAGQMGKDPQDQERIRRWLGGLCGVDLHEVSEKIRSERIEILGVSWSPWSPRMLANDSMFPSGGVWMSFYSASNLDRAISDPQLLARCRTIVPKLIVDNEAVVPWYPGEGENEAFLLPMSAETTYGWARLVFATFRLGAQRGLCEQAKHRTERPERRRTARAQLPERDVMVLRLRRSEHDPQVQVGVGREYTCRWPVRGHWRQQWYPSVQDHRPIWINQHIKGPDDAPLRGGERVTMI
jgi:hypothetical protein